MKKEEGQQKQKGEEKPIQTLTSSMQEAENTSKTYSQDQEKLKEILSLPLKSFLNNFFSGIYEIQLRLSTLPSSLWLGPKQSPQKRDTQITNS